MAGTVLAVVHLYFGLGERRSECRRTERNPKLRPERKPQNHILRTGRSPETRESNSRFKRKTFQKAGIFAMPKHRLIDKLIDQEGENG